MKLFQLYFIGILLWMISFGISTASPHKDNHYPYCNVPCDDFYTPGSIGPDQVLCLNNNLPATIESLSLANDGNGIFEYQWVMTTQPPAGPTVVWQPIPGAVNASYTPPPLYQTTWFRRCTRPIGCLIFGAESDAIKIKVEPCVLPCETFEVTVFHQSNPNCAGAEDGEIALTVSGGVPPYSIKLNGQTTSALTYQNLGSGTFGFEVTDAMGCTATTQATLIDPEPLQIAVQANPETCHKFDGALHVKIKGGTPPYHYNWSTGDQTPSVTDLEKGTYWMSAKDQNNCSLSKDIQLPGNCSPLSISFRKDQQKTLPDGTVELNWRAFNEQPDGVFLVEHSLDGYYFENLGIPVYGLPFVQQGNLYKLMVDARPGEHYYRICHLNPAGEMHFSSVVTLTNQTNKMPRVQNYPNPVRSIT